MKIRDLNQRLMKWPAAFTIWIDKDFQSALHYRPLHVQEAETDDWVSVVWTTAPDQNPQGWTENTMTQLTKLYPDSHFSSGVTLSGNYCKMPDNLPVVDQVKKGLWVCGGVSGYGIMAAMGMAELLGECIAGGNSKFGLNGRDYNKKGFQLYFLSFNYACY